MQVEKHSVDGAIVIGFAGNLKKDSSTNPFHTHVIQAAEAGWKKAVLDLTKLTPDGTVARELVNADRNFRRRLGKMSLVVNAEIRRDLELLGSEVPLDIHDNLEAALQSLN